MNGINSRNMRLSSSQRFWADFFFLSGLGIGFLIWSLGVYELGFAENKRV